MIMKKESYLNRLSVAADLRRFVFLVLTASIALNFFLVAAVIELPKGVKHELVPPLLSKTFWVGGDQFDRAHLEEMGIYVVQLMLNVTPKSVRFQGDQLLKIIDPQYHAELANQIQVNAAMVERLNVATTFMPSSYSYDPKFPNRIAVHGAFQTHFSDKTIGSSSKVYMIEFGRSVAGKMTLVRFKETSSRDVLGIEKDFREQSEEKGDRP
jgi:conjugal transfer pilus assembly protein TraE